MSDNTKEQETAVLCALLDMQGAYDAMERGDVHSHDWKAHMQTMDELMEAFPNAAQRFITNQEKPDDNNKDSN